MTSSPLSRGPRAALAAVALGVLAAGCAVAPGSAAPASPRPVASTPGPSPSAAGPVHPLTGLPQVGTAPVVAIKVDNSPLARPYHRGLDRAAVVYQELMEGGSTRFLAVYDGTDGREVGPIRSVRENDLDLLRPYGRVVVGSSGGNTGVKRKFAAVARAGRLLDASYDALPASYRLGEQRRDARNFFAAPARLAGKRPAGSPPRYVGLRFGPRPVGTPVRTARAEFSPFSVVDVRYDPPSGRWAVAQDGRRMARVAAANVVVQRVRVRGSQYSDVNGQTSPFSVTTGRGAVTVLRDGLRIDGTWRRLGTANGPRLLDAKGRDIPLKPGPTWVLLLPVGQPVTFG